jgi:integrase
MKCRGQGKRKKKRVGPTKADKRRAEQIAEKINAALILGTFPTAEASGPEPVPFDKFAGKWFRREVQLPMERRMEGALAPSSVRNHELYLRKYLIPFFGGRDIRSIRIANIQELHDHCLELEPPLSTRSIDLILSTLGRVFVYAEAQELVESHPVVAWKRARGRRRSSSAKPIQREKALDSEELDLFLSIAKREHAAWYPFILFLADTGARLGEASALRWIDVSLEGGVARITRSFSNGKFLSLPKTRRERTVELSARLRDILARVRPDIVGEEALVFANEAGGFIDPHHFRDRVFRRIAKKALGPARQFTPHGLRHAFASLHLARGTNLKWVQNMGSWASAKLLLDLYGHFLPTETTGFADALSDAPARPYAAPLGVRAAAMSRRIPETRTPPRRYAASRTGANPPTRRFGI